jgi:hypothetical protein
MTGIQPLELDAGRGRALSLRIRGKPPSLRVLRPGGGGGDDGALPERPKTRGDCLGGPRPCPFVSCQYHLFLDVLERTGTIRLNFPHLEPWQLVETCALDVADRGGTTLQDVGGLVNLTRERIRQIEDAACEKLRPLLAPHVDEDEQRRRWRGRDTEDAPEDAEQLDADLDGEQLDADGQADPGASP